MKVRILHNFMDYGDAVSSCCILLKKRCREMGIEAQIYSEGFHPEVSGHGVHLSRLLDESTEDDILLHQFCIESRHLVLAEQFPGRRVLIYQNITPPSWFPPGSEFERACQRGIDQLRSVRSLYEYVVGASDFTRGDLEKLGFKNPGLLPVLVDPDALLSVPPVQEVLAKRKPEMTTFLFVGRVAPNKRIEDLLQFLATYRAQGHTARLLIVGKDTQMNDYTAKLTRLASSLSLELGKDVIFTGKVPVTHLHSYYRIADAFLCMSEHEGFCVPLIESMAFGLPTFAFAATACEQTMAGNGSGKSSPGVFYRKDFPELAGWIAESLENPERRSAIMEAQRARLRDFTPEAEGELVSSLLGQVLTLPSREEKRGKVRVSVVVNTYNRASVLDRCMASLEGQTFTNFEVVVVNGPSTDNTLERLERFRTKIKLIQTDTRVLSKSRNLGIEAAAGDLVAFIDDDAIAAPDWLESMISAFDDPEVGGAGGFVYQISGGTVAFSNGLINRWGVVRPVEPEPGTAWDWTGDWLNTVQGCNCVFRRSALEKIGGFDERIEWYHDEADVVLRMRMAGYKTVHRPQAIVHHEQASSHNRTNPYDLNWTAVLKNGAYCPIKNYEGARGPRGAAWEVAGHLFHEFFRPPLRWWRSGETGFGMFCRIEWRCARGLIAGIRKGLGVKPVYAELPLSKAPEFLPFNPARLRSVCLVSQGLPPGQVGGVATYSMALAQQLRDLGCMVHLISKGAETHSEWRDGLWFHAVAPQSLGNVTGVSEAHPIAGNILNHSAAVCAKILEIAARHTVDIVEAPSWDSEALVTVLDDRIPVAVRVVTPLATVMETQQWPDNEDMRLACDLEQETLSRAAAVIFTTQSMRGMLEDKLQVRPALMTHIPFGLQLSASRAQRNGAGPKKVLFVGRLEARKGIHVLLDAIPGVLKAIPDAEFRIVGKDVSGNGDSLAHTWARRYPDHRNTVRFYGEVSDQELSEHYEKCDLLVAPSLYESFGLIYVEAMARKKAVIGTSTGGIPEVVRDGVTGLLVPPGDSDQLERAITKLLRDDDLRHRIAEAGYQSYVEDFSAEIMAKRTLQFYQEVIHGWAERKKPVWTGNFAATSHGRYAPAHAPGTLVVWDPVGRHSSLVAAPGEERIICYGPYMPLENGHYRAEFALWTEENLTFDQLIAKVDVFAGRPVAERRIFGRDLSGGRGSILDLFFSIEGAGENQVEFRVATSGLVPLHLQSITVSRYPHAPAN